MLSLFEGGLFPVQANLGIALAVCDASHAQVHAHLGALAVEIGLQLIEDELLVLVGDGLVVLHGFGVDAIFVLSGERLLTFELLERACRSVAYGAFRGRLGAFVDVTAYAADPFGFHIHYPFTLWFLRRCRRGLYIFTAVFICVHGLEIFGAVFANWADEIGWKVFAFVDVTANRALPCDDFASIGCRAGRARRSSRLSCDVAVVVVGDGRLIGKAARLDDFAHIHHMASHVDALDDAAIEKRDGTFLENEAAFGARWVRSGNGSVVARDEFLDVVPAFHAEMLKILKRRGFVEHRDAEPI